MLMPGDPRVLADAVTEFTSGLATGYLGAKKSQRESDIAAGETPDPPGRFERFIQAANPDERRTIDETLSMDLGTLNKELSGLKTSDELFGWIKNNSALAASPIGNRMLNVIGQTAQRMSQVETESLGYIAAKRMAVEKADLMVKYGLGPDATQDQISTARASENEMSFMTRASKDMDKDVSGLVTPQDFDSNGNWLPGSQQRILKAAPFTVGRELASERADIARANLEIDRAHLGLRGIGTQLRARESGVAIDNLPGVPPPLSPRQTPRPEAFDGVTVTPIPSATNAAPAPATAPTLRTVERPLTTANVTALQKSDFEADSALVRLDILKRTIKENPDAFGVVGVGKEFAEILSGITNPNADATITKARQEAGLTFVELAESLRTDTGNMSRWEQERLKDLGDTRSWKDNPARALAKAETIQKLVIGKKLRVMKALRASPDDNFLRQLPNNDADIQALYDDGLLSLSDARRWHDLQPEPPR